MKLKRICIAILLCLGMVLPVMAGCGKVLPTVIKDSDSFELDLYAGSGKVSKTVTVSEYLDVNGAENVTFSLSKSNDFVNLSSVSNGKFTITAKAKGTSVVTIQAVQDGESVEGVKAELTVEVIETAVYAVEGLGDLGNVTVAGAVEVVEGGDYAFTVTVSLGYVGTPSVSYSIGGGAAQSLTHASVSGKVYAFLIPASAVTGAIEILSVSGVTEDPNAIPVTFPKSNAMFELSGSPRGMKGENYELTVALIASFYTAGNTPSAEIGFSGVRAEYTVGSQKKTVDGVLNGDAFQIVIPAADTGLLNQTDGLVINSISPVGLKTAEFADSFFTAAGWTGLGAKSGTSNNTANAETTLNVVAPEVDDTGIVKFENNSASINNMVAGAAAQNGSYPDRFYHHSFMLKAQTDFDMILFGTSTIQYATSGIRSQTGWQEGNWIRMFSEDGKIGLHTRQNQFGLDGVPLASGSTAPFLHLASAVVPDGIYTKNTWTRFDLVYWRSIDEEKAGAVVTLMLFIDGEKVELEETEKIIDSSKVTDGNFSFVGRRVAEETSIPNFGRYFAVAAKSGAPVWFAKTALEAELKATNA